MIRGRIRIEPMTEKQQRWVEHYLGRANGNATEAARLAGYAGTRHTLEQVGYENLRKPEIETAVQEFRKANAMPAEELLGRLADQARGPSQYLNTITGTDVVVDVDGLLRDGKGHLIKAAKYTDKGQPIIEFYDAQAALVNLGRNLKLFTDKTESTIDERQLNDAIERELAKLAGGGAGTVPGSSEGA
jgi:hypothetical protein